MRKLVNATAKRINGVGGYERHELLLAAHGVIVVAAFFDTLRKNLAASHHSEITLTDQEKTLLVTGTRAHESTEQLVTLLSSTDIPLPMDGGMGDSADLREFYEKLSESVIVFLENLKKWKQLKDRESIITIVRATPTAAAKKYVTYFLDLANDVEEFYFWATLSEHRFTRKKLDQNYDGLRQAIEAQSSSLGRLHDILAELNYARTDPDNRARTSVSRANRAALTDSIVSTSILEHIGPVDLPSVGQIYQTPRFRWSYAQLAVPADESWWAELPILDDIDLFLAAYLKSAQSVLEPMLILGHPGAGKSLLTKVLAARAATRQLVHGRSCTTSPGRRARADTGPDPTGAGHRNQPAGQLDRTGR